MTKTGDDISESHEECADSMNLEKELLSIRRDMECIAIDKYFLDDFYEWIVSATQESRAIEDIIPIISFSLDKKI